MTTRPVVAVRHSQGPDGELLEGWPVIGEASSWPEAEAVAKEAGYEVGGSRYPRDMVPAETMGTEDDAYGVCVIVPLPPQPCGCTSDGSHDGQCDGTECLVEAGVCTECGCDKN